MDETQRIELNLRQSEERYRLAQEATGVGIWDWDVVNDHLYWDDYMWAMISYPPDNRRVSYTHWRSMLHPEDLAGAEQEVQRQLHLGQGFVIEFRLRTRDGSWRWVQGRGKVVARTGDGAPSRMMGTHTDIHERKQAEAALQESEFRWKFAIEGSGDGLWDWNVPKSTVFFSLRWKEMLGFAAHEIGSGLDEWSKRVHPEDLAQVMAEVQLHLDGKTPLYSNEHRVRCKDGRWKWILDRGLVVERDAANKPLRVIGTHTDITERKQSQLALEQKKQEMEQLIYSVSHDLKSPLITVKTFVRMLRQDIQDGNQQQITEDLKYIDSSTDKMQQLLDALLKYSRIGTVDVPAQTVSADQQLHNCLTTLAGILQQHQVQVSTSDLPHQLHGDPLHFGQIWQNLIENAVKYLGDQAHPHIEIGATQQEHEVIFYVRDNGMGIAPEHRERIFNLFSQLNPGSDGSGLGLALVKKIVTIYQGRIWVESDGKGTGSCFMFTLPGALIKGDPAT